MSASKDKILRGWSIQQVKSFAKEAIKDHRAAWDLVPSLRVAIIGQKYASIVSNQGVEMVSSLHLSTLWTDLLEAAGLLGA